MAKAQRRRSLRDLDYDAMATTPPTPQTSPATPGGKEAAAAAAPARQPRAERPKPVAEPRRPASAAPASAAPAGAGPVRKASTSKMAIYLHRSTFDDAKSAYLVDLDLPDAEGSIARWISAAIERWAELTPAERRHRAGELPEERREGSGLSRTFDIGDNAIEATKQAMLDDRAQARVYESRSQFVTDAIRVAIEQSRDRVGTLPPAPARLPNRPL